MGAGGYGEGDSGVEGEQMTDREIEAKLLFKGDASFEVSHQSGHVVRSDFLFSDVVWW